MSRGGRLRTRKEWLDTLASLVRSTDYGWDRDYASMQRRPFDVAKLRSLVDVDYDPDRLNRIQDDPVAIHMAMLQDLRDDVRRLLPGPQQALMDRCDFGLIPSGKFTAVTIGPSKCADGYVVGFHNGLVHALALIAAAMVVETFDEPEGKFGGPYYRESLAFRGTVDAERFERALWSLGDFPEEIVVRISANQAVMLWFVALHEAGHIAHGDVDADRSAARLGPDEATVTSTAPEWSREYAADAYALSAFLSKQPSPGRAWTNFASIELMFRWMAYTEGENRERETHPPALLRLRELRRGVERDWGPDEQGYSGYLDDRFREWRAWCRTQEGRR